MTDEEMAEKYAEKVVRHKMAVHCIFNEKVTKKEIKDAVMYGLKAGKDMAEADLAAVAYMQGAERYKPKWHNVVDGDLPKEESYYWSKLVLFQTNKGDSYVGFFDYADKAWYEKSTDDVIFGVIA